MLALCVMIRVVVPSCELTPSKASITRIPGVRHGDRDVEIELRDLSLWRGRTPVLVDDIISSGRTMVEAVRLLTEGWPSPICVAVHRLFADNSDLLLERAGARVITTNSVPHRTNAIELRALLADGVKEVALRLS